MLRIHKTHLLILSFLILASPVYSAAAENIPWSPDQATGAPNSPKVGDQKTAWASLAQDKGAEWIKLEYKTPVEVHAVRIYENFNPGAISKVTGFDKEGTEVLVWEGKEPLKKAPNIFEVQSDSKLVSQSIKVYLDTTRVKGWNEIDAVQLVGSDDSKQWATKASASSTYATRNAKREITWETLPPSVIKTFPQAGSTDVDPALKEISVTFSKDMLTERMWAVVQISKEMFPKTRKGIHYLKDKRTCVIPVDLEPGKTYVLWFNRGRYNSFRDTENNPAVPYQLVFKTKLK
ncbi:Ig-like domain-containing protein [uncultured Gimesia sp.]|uniref:Ig-like domain-containing protein n=1 Tax=uncultured Gimesia sp. TaxID=1678688 RepID=UPI0030DCF9F3|tara:strand:- start:29924 stop:30796 length:873 start_codon:yes stop_codon:yes gene_type:complete